MPRHLLLPEEGSNSVAVFFFLNNAVLFTCAGSEYRKSIRINPPDSSPTETWLFDLDTPEETKPPEPSLNEQPQVIVDTEIPISDEKETSDLEDLPPMESLLMGGSNTDQSVELTAKTIGPKFYAKSDSVTGALQYSYKITTPPGRNGVEPSLNLTYTNQGNNEINEFGYGWSMDIPYIARINKTGVENLYNQNYFYSSLDGELRQIGTTTDTYGALVDTGKFNKYQYASSTYWIITDKLGNTYKFGTSTATRQDDPGNSNRVYKWMLEEIKDPNGNVMHYQYAKDKGQIYPLKITYTGNASTTGAFTIDFLRESRSDFATSSALGFAVVPNQRIYQIDVSMNNSCSNECDARSVAAGESIARYVHKRSFWPVGPKELFETPHGRHESYCREGEPRGYPPSITKRQRERDKHACEHKAFRARYDGVEEYECIHSGNYSSSQRCVCCVYNF